MSHCWHLLARPVGCNADAAAWGFSCGAHMRIRTTAQVWRGIWGCWLSVTVVVQDA